MGKRELVALLNLSSWCLVMVGWLFLAVPWGCLRFVIVVFPDHTYLLFLYDIVVKNSISSCFHYNPNVCMIEKCIVSYTCTQIIINMFKPNCKNIKYVDEIIR